MIEINRTKSVCNKKRRFVDRENRRFPSVSWAGNLVKMKIYQRI